MTGAYRWRNVPVPEWHVAGLLGGGVLHWLRPWTLPIDRPAGSAVGSLLVFVGLVVVGRSVRVVGRQSIDAPETLVTMGPYRYSRNPMYVAWTALYVGIALVVEAAWPLVLLPVLAVVTHRTVRREERRFADDYAAYCERVRRYL